MTQTMVAFLFAAGTVVLAEMGDKTQLLAMAFATKYKASKVMLGVFIATIFNHALAVAVGSFLMRFNSLATIIQAAAALSFIFFGLWTIRGDKLEGEENRVSKFGPVATVAIAFFIAEMGDKTQLATISIAARFSGTPLGVLAGTTVGMLIADGIGIILGVVMCKRIPEKTVKLVSAGAFVLFGFIASYQVATDMLKLSLPITLLILVSLAAITATIAYFLIKNFKQPEPQIACQVRDKNELK